MGLDYFRCYYSYRKKLENLSDQELGRLFRSVLEYGETGVSQKLTGRESVAFDFIVDDINREKAAYERRCEANARNGSRGGRPSKRETEKSEHNRKNPIGSLGLSKSEESQTKETKQSYGFGEELEHVFRDWLEYKKEKRQAYKPKGLEVLVNQVRKYSAECGEQAVVDLIRLSMANGWQGIIWDKIKAQKMNDSLSKIVSPVGQNAWMKKYIDAREE